MTTKTFFVLGAMLFVPRSLLEANIKNVVITPVAIPKILVRDSIYTPLIVERVDWDERWGSLKRQYEISLGQPFSFIIAGKRYTKYASRPNYVVSENLNSIDELNKVIKGIVIHDMEVRVLDTESDVDQVRRIRDGQITGRGFNDIAYHFVIGSHGTIFLCRPENFMGIHAGEVSEVENYQVIHIPEWSKGPVPSTPEDQMKMDSIYCNAMRMDPDYGYLGVALCGNFNAGYDKPTEAQMQSLEWLLAHLKVKYDIPFCGIIFHNQVKAEVVEASGLTLKSPKKSCPGVNFPERECILENLPEDSELAKSKNVLCFRFKN